MNAKGRNLWTALFLCVVLALGGCAIDLDRNADGSLRLETQMPEEAIQKEIRLALADPQIQDLTADLRDGTIAVSGVRLRATGDKTDTMSFLLDLGARDGHMTAEVSDAEINGIPIPAETVAQWNENIAQNLEQSGQRNPDSTLQSVTVTSEAVTMVWRIETRRSKGE
jgi:hypothetical protein